MISAVLFDHDGTLVDAEPAHQRLWNDVLAPYGVVISDEEYRLRYAGLPERASAIDIVSFYNLDAEPASLQRVKQEAARAYLSQSAFPLMPGAREAVTTLAARGVRMAVVTGAERSGIEATVRAYQWDSMFETIVSGQDVAHSKPAPDGYLLALQRLALPARACVAIEDTAHGVNAAAAAGIRCLAVPTAMTLHQDFTNASSIHVTLHEAMTVIAR